MPDSFSLRQNAAVRSPSISPFCEQVNELCVHPKSIIEVRSCCEREAPRAGISVQYLMEAKEFYWRIITSAR